MSYSRRLNDSLVLIANEALQLFHEAGLRFELPNDYRADDVLRAHHLAQTALRAVDARADLPPEIELRLRAAVDALNSAARVGRLLQAAEVRGLPLETLAELVSAGGAAGESAQAFRGAVSGLFEAKARVRRQAAAQREAQAATAAKRSLWNRPALAWCLALPGGELLPASRLAECLKAESGIKGLPSTERITNKVKAWRQAGALPAWRRS